MYSVLFLDQQKAALLVSQVNMNSQYFVNICLYTDLAL